MNLPQVFPRERVRKHFGGIRNQLEFGVASEKGNSFIE